MLFLTIKEQTGSRLPQWSSLAIKAIRKPQGLFFDDHATLQSATLHCTFEAASIDFYFAAFPSLF